MKIRNLTSKISSNWEVNTPDHGKFGVMRIKREGYFTPIRPVCEALGFDWSGQRVKILEHKEQYRPGLIMCQGRDNKKRLMLCMPMSKLEEWANNLDIRKAQLDGGEFYYNYEHIIPMFDEDNLQRVYNDDGFMGSSTKRRKSHEVSPLGLAEFCGFLVFKRKLNFVELLLSAKVRAIGRWDPQFKSLGLDPDVWKELGMGWIAKDPQDDLLPMFDQICFLAKDVCEFLGLSNSRAAARRLQPEHLVNHLAGTAGGKQEMTFISLDGVKDLIFKSTRPEMRRLKKLVDQQSN